MKTIVNKKKQLSGLLYGLAAGFAFSLFAWGIDAFLLAKANGAYPWVKYVPALIISLIAGGFIGWVTVRIQNTLISIVLWTSFALLLSKMIVWLPMKAAPYLIKLFNSHLGDYLDYPFYEEFSQIQWFGFFPIVIVAIVCALIENTLIDQSLFSTGKIAIIVPLMVCALCFGLVGGAADGLFNKPIREPVQTVDNLLQFAVDNIDKEVSPELRRSMHLAAVNTIKEYLPRERTLILSNFDRSFGQIDILVDFNGYWIKCSTIYNQVTYCKEALETPQSLLSHFNFSAIIDLFQLRTTYL